MASTTLSRHGRRCRHVHVHVHAPGTRRQDTMSPFVSNRFPPPRSQVTFYIQYISTVVVLVVDFDSTLPILDCLGTTVGKYITTASSAHFRFDRPKALRKWAELGRFLASLPSSYLCVALYGECGSRKSRPNSSGAKRWTLGRSLFLIRDGCRGSLFKNYRW